MRKSSNKEEEYRERRLEMLRARQRMRAGRK
jgi:hypothetical protein